MTRGRRLALVLLLLLPAAASCGDVLFRLGRRFPDSRGALDGIWAGDQFEFLHRTRLALGRFSLVLVAEKDRGEEWCDLVSAGATFEDSIRNVRATAGWLRSKLGSGLILSHPSGWSGAPGMEAKPPALASKLEPASSAGCSDAEPLTGAGVSFRAGRFSFLTMGASSRIDPSGEGLHRTESELAAEGSVKEDLLGFRAVTGCWGLGAAAADDPRGGWSRVGLDFDGRLAGVDLRAEAAVGFQGSEMSEAFWGCIHERFDAVRFCVGVFRHPDDFPSRRSALPIGMDCDAGAGAAFVWKPGAGWTAEGSVTSALRREASRGSAELSLEKRMTPAFDLGIRFRGTTRDDEDYFRLLGSSSWRPAGGVVLSTAVQRTGAGLSSSGTGAEARLKILLDGELTVRVAAAGFVTDDYDSRVYFGELSFPGDFGSVQQWGEGFYLQAAVACPVGGGSSISGRMGYLRKGSVESIGEGSDETDGPSRLDATLQFQSVI
ncbi:MAG TPA: hypothetical protein PLX54_04760 [Candidatus Fermentibacter daniensis]|nr:hypothetical protein [Candidatus Fermentibacter daniensis]HOR08073.1 hypothetical protein [Candidatus Fermentibacter daniensis]HPK51665.1 hypothetical protein [Candidatus Fermentibacter daniensis]